MAQTKSCAINPVKVHFINGMFNSEQDVIKTHERLKGIFLFNSDNRKKVDWLNLVDVDYSHNQSLVVYSNGVEVLNTPADLVKVLGNKIDDKFGRNDDETWAKFAKFYFLGSVGEGADIDLEYAKFLQENLKPDLDQLVADQSIRQQDLLKMAGQLSPYIENRDKVLLISHSQGNFFADDLMNVMLPNRDDPNSVSGDRFKFWGNLQLASPVSNPVMASSRYRSMKFTQDLIANQFLGQPGTHSLVRSSAGDFFKTLSGHNAAYFLSEELLTDRLSDNRRGSPLSFVLEHLSDISDQFPSNCAPMEPSFEVTTSNLSKSGKFVAKYSTVDINYQTINFGNDIIDLNEANRTKLISEFHVQDFDRVDLECINVDENPYFCDEPLTREPASIRLNSTSSNPNLIVKNTFGESVQVPLRNIASDLVVYNGNEPEFAPTIEVLNKKVTSTNESIVIELDVKAVDVEFPENTSLTVNGQNIIESNNGTVKVRSIQYQQPNNGENTINYRFTTFGLLGAIATLDYPVTFNYCSGDECCVDGEKWSYTKNKCGKVSGPPIISCVVQDPPVIGGGNYYIQWTVSCRPTDTTIELTTGPGSTYEYYFQRYYSQCGVPNYSGPCPQEYWPQPLSGTSLSFFGTYFDFNTDSYQNWEQNVSISFPYPQLE